MDQKLLQSLEWRCIGPHRGGRSVAVAGHPTEQGTFYFGAVAGGVWKTTSGGALWENISDGYLKTSAIGAIAVSEADANVIYIGTGETSIRSNVSHGDGVYKTTDGGKSWTNVGLKETRHIGDIQIHPKNEDIVYVAALGHAWGPNEDRGVYRTVDGGRSWDRILYKSSKAGAIDISLDPSNPRVIFAAMWEGQRYPHAASSGGEDSGIWRSTDGGDTWEDITRNKGLIQEGILGKIGVAASPARSGRVWALIEAEEGGLFRSDDNGDSWQNLTDNPDLRRRPWYYMHVFADPSDSDTVWILNLACWKSIDGGKTFEQIPTPHGDNHGLWIDPRDSKRIIEGNDGGACVTFDGGFTWSSILNQPTAQFYHVTTDNQIPYNVYGSQQDNWAMRVPSIDFEGAISQRNYVEPGGGESGYIAISPKPPHKVYGGGIGTGLGHGRLIAWNPETGQKRNVTVWPEVHGFGAGADAMKYRFQWTFPVEFSPHDDDTLYACSNYVHRSTDEGTSWEVISPDLTRNDPEKIKSSGGPITADNSGAEIYCTIFAFKESAQEKGVFWAGSDDGLVNISRDDGKSWNDVTPPDLPEWALISVIELSPHDAGTAYVAATRYKHDDTKPYLYKTNDYGESWTSITNGIPVDEFTRVIRADPKRQGLLYAGTELGVCVSFDDGKNWQPLESNLPVTPIHDIVVKDTDLVAGTHGRSFWILDDLTPLHQMHEAMSAQSVALFKPRPTIRFRVYGRAFGRTSGITNYKMTGPVTVAYRPVETATGATREAFLDAGSNPPDGVIIHYYLKDASSEDVTLEILEADGEVIRSFSSKSEDPPRVPTGQGANRFIWDMRGRKATKLDDPPPNDRFGQMMEDAVAPRVIPGEYQVRLTVGETVVTETFEILADPRLTVSADDLRRQYELKAAVRDDVSRTHEALNQLRMIRKHVKSWEERFKDGDNPEIADAATAAKDALSEVESTLINVDANKPQPGTSKLKEKLVALSVMIDESDDAPTKGAQELHAQLGDQVEATKARLGQVIRDDVEKLNRLLLKSNVPIIATS
ncbi:MAG TPA: glycosyl hydrolase [Thermomicrobiales bacterium]|nr:glycosyl hydrolase [Thermomicrobiales bacterium]